MDPVAIPRRRVLGGLLAAGALLPFAPALLRAGKGTRPVSARFVREGAAVTLDWWAPLTFRLSPAIGAADTAVLDGAIHLLVRPSIGSGGAARVLRIGDLPPEAEGRREGSVGGLGAVTAASLVPGAAGSVRLERLADLAAAQRAAGRLAAAMDMTLCAGDVEALTRWFRRLPGGEDAVVATPDGWSLAGPPGLPDGPGPTLPAGVPVEDFRLPVPSGPL